MSRWFRHYAGMMRDEKLVRAAVKAKQPVERVVWIWGAILESAAEVNDGGRYDFDASEAAYFLRCDESDVVGVLDALGNEGRVSEGIVVRWGDRQFDSDKSRDRQKRYRDRLKSSGDGGSDVTPPSRDAEVTPQETETEEDTETERYKPPASVVVPGAREFDELLEAFPRNPQCSETRAEAAWRATKAKDRPLIFAAARRYAAWFLEDCEARDRTPDAGKRFVPFLATWIESGDWRKPVVLKADAYEPDPNLVVLKAGDPLLKAIEQKLRGGRPFAVGDGGTVTVRRSDAEAVGGVAA